VAPDDLSRPLRISRIAVLGDDAVVVDEILPIAVEVSARDGVGAVHTWELSAACRGRPTTNDVALTEHELLIASPAAGGLVRIDRQTGACTSIALDAEPIHVVVVGDDVWVTGWDRKDLTQDRVPRLGATTISHPVVWEDGTEDLPWARVWTVPESPRPTLEEARADDPETVTVEVVGPVWRVPGTVAERIDFGGHVRSIGGTPDTLVVVCRMPDDPRIKRLQWGGSVAHLYPASVLLDTGDGTFVVIGKARSGSRLIATRDGTLLLATVAGDGACTLRRIDTDGRRLDDPLPLSTSWLREFLHLGFFGDDRVASLSGSPGAGPMTVSVGSFAGGPTGSVVLSDRIEWRSFAVSSSLIWCWRTDVPQLLAIDPASLDVREIPVPIGTAPYAPEVGVPEIDLAAHDHAQLTELRSAFLRTREDGFGDIWPRIDGVTFESVELVGEFPYTAVVGFFSIEDHPGRRFGRRWRLYDDLGNVIELGYFFVYLIEDIETGHADRVVADTDESELIVWI
jgi:hypothetical protein